VLLLIGNTEYKYSDIFGNKQSARQSVGRRFHK